MIEKQAYGALVVKLCKEGAFGDKPMQKMGSFDRRMTYTPANGIPRFNLKAEWVNTFVRFLCLSVPLL